MENSNLMCLVDWQIVTTIILGLMAGLIALAQVRKNIIMSASLKWIDELRGMTSRYLTNINGYIENYRALEGKYHQLIADGKEPYNEPDFIEKYRNPTEEIAEKLDLLHNKINLYLNPNLDNHNEVEKELDYIMNTIRQSFSTNEIILFDKVKEDITTHLDKLMLLMQTIFIEKQKKTNSLF